MDWSGFSIDPVHGAHRVASIVDAGNDFVAVSTRLIAHNFDPNVTMDRVAKAFLRHTAGLLETAAAASLALDAIGGVFLSSDKVPSIFMFSTESGTTRLAHSPLAVRMCPICDAKRATRYSETGCRTVVSYPFSVAYLPSTQMYRPVGLAPGLFREGDRVHWLIDYSAVCSRLVSTWRFCETERTGIISVGTYTSKHEVRSAITAEIRSANDDSLVWGACLTPSQDLVVGHHPSFSPLCEFC